METRCTAFIVAAALFVPAVLLSDGRGLWRQGALCLATAAFLWLFARRSPVASPQIICAIIVATAGELALSVGWGLYHYRFALIPLYVPIGHGLFYTLAAETARQDFFRRRSRGFVTTVIISGTVLSLALLITLNDQWGFLWWLIAAPLILVSRNSLLLSLCFVYTMLLEWTGTAIGNWRWVAEVPGLHIHSANPPSGVGILYVLLDLITVALMARAWRGHVHPTLQDAVADA